jgi:hypothetical protein
MSGYPQQPPGPLAPAKPSGNPFAGEANPYAAPQLGGYYQPVPQQPAQLPPFAGLWRQGNVMVMHRHAPLPDICLKSNQPTQKRLKRNLQWHHPAIALTILAGVLIYIILAAILTKRATILVPLTEEWFRRRRTRLLVAWLTGLAGLGLMVLGFVMLADSEEGMYALLLVAGLVVALGALIFGQYACAMVRPTRMTDEYLWLKGVHPEYLNRLEPWPYNI